jgi:CysZ protein
VTTQVRRQSPISEFFTGIGLLLRGVGLVFGSPRLLLLGLIPGVISFTVVAIALGTLLYFIDDVSAAATWFAAGWSADARRAIELLAGVAIVGVGAVVSVLTFTALTITIGDPFYEAIAKRVDQRFGGARAEELPWHRTLVRNLVDSLRLVALSLLVSVLLFGLGLIPVVGQTAVPVIGALVGGWLLAVEIAGVPFNLRGLRLRDRRRMLRTNRALALGFGVPVFLLFLVPFVAIVVMPGAVAGATLMTRRVLGEPHE